MLALPAQLVRLVTWYPNHRPPLDPSNPHLGPSNPTPALCPPPPPPELAQHTAYLGLKPRTRCPTLFPCSSASSTFCLPPPCFTLNLNSLIPQPLNSANPAAGVVTRLDRRRQIYSICCKHDVIILEDGPYLYLQFSASSVAPRALQDLGPSYHSLHVDGRVIRLDSFSKVCTHMAVKQQGMQRQRCKVALS